MLLGHERIVKDKRISISVEESDDPYILTLQNGEVIKIKASEEQDNEELQACQEMQNEIKTIFNAVHPAYIESTRGLYTFS